MGFLRRLFGLEPKPTLNEKIHTATCHHTMDLLEELQEEFRKDREAFRRERDQFRKERKNEGS